MIIIRIKFFNKTCSPVLQATNSNEVVNKIPRRQRWSSGRSTAAKVANCTS